MTGLSSTVSADGVGDASPGDMTKLHLRLLPHSRQSMKPGLSVIKSAIRNQSCLSSSGSVGDLKKRTLGSCSSLGKEEETPTKKRLKSVQLHNAEHIETTPVQPTPESPLALEGKPNYLASSLTLEEANGLLKGATVNVGAVSVLEHLPDEQASAEFARAVALQVYHAYNLIEKHEKLLSSHLDSHAKLEGLQEDNKELMQELLCAKESVKQNEETMKKQIQSLEEKLKKSQEENADNLKKSREENAELRQKIMKLKMDLSKAEDMKKEEILKFKRNEENMKKQIQSFEDKLKKTEEENADNVKKIQEENTDNLKKVREENADNLKKTREENAELRQKVMELEMDLSKAKDSEKDEFLNLKCNEENMKNQIQSLENNLKKTQEENGYNLKKTQQDNAELRQTIKELEMDLSKAKDTGKEEFLNSKRNEESLNKQILSLEDKLKKILVINVEQQQTIKKLKMDLSKAEDMGKEEFINSKRNEESLNKQIQILEDKLKKILVENVEQRQMIKELKMDLSKSKRNEESLKKQVQSFENQLKKTEKENAENLKKTSEEIANNLKEAEEERNGLYQKILELEMDLSKAKEKGKMEFLDSNGFYRRVSHFNSTYYMSGMRIGICQAVNKYQHLDPKIVEFEPDFDDDCGYDVPDPPPYSSPIRLVPPSSMFETRSLSGGEEVSTLGSQDHRL